MSASYITLDEIAKRYLVSVPTVRKWIDTGLLVGHRQPLSKHRRVLLSDFTNFLSKHPVPVTKD